MQASKLVHALCYHLYTLWLFNRNDIKTMVLPSIAFSFFQSTHFHLRRSEFLARLPLMLTYTWFNLLAFSVNNQCHASAIAEDTLNKPWRPMPSNRLTPSQAKRLGTIVIPAAISISALLGGGFRQSLLLAALGIIYNSFGGGNSHWLLRNALNAAGFTSFATGTLEVALQAPFPRSTSSWVLLIFLTVCSSVHVQDMYDQVGDAAAGRRTLPLVIGPYLARLCVAVAVVVWSLVCPLYWVLSARGTETETGVQGLGLLGLGSLVLGFGEWICVRILTKQSVQEDRVTFRLYNAWLVSLYALPMLTRSSSRFSDR